MEKWAKYKQGQTFPKKSLRFIALTKLVVLAFENLNDHETLMKENIIPPILIMETSSNLKSFWKHT